MSGFPMFPARTTSKPLEEEDDDRDGYPDPEDEPEDPDEEFLDMVCGMRPDGHCSLAGSETCDWECPRNK